MAKLQEIESKRREGLERARAQRRMSQTSRKNPSSENEEEEQVDSEDAGFGFLLYVALVFAIFKDMLDLIGIGSIPLIGTLVTFLIATTIAMLMFIADAGISSRKFAKRTARKFVTLLAGSGVEALAPGINILPIETITVIIIILMSKADKSRVLKLLKKQNQ